MQAKDERWMEQRMRRERTGLSVLSAFASHTRGAGKCSAGMEGTGKPRATPLPTMGVENCGLSCGSEFNVPLWRLWSGS
jgi:hypothetical protein